MGRLRRFFFCLIYLLLIAPRLFSQALPAVTATGHVYAEVIPIFSASEASAMNFGRFSPGSEGGEIILTPESTISVIGSIYTGPGVQNAGSFSLSGDLNASYMISLPSDPVILKHSSSPKTMIIHDWISNIGTGTGAGILQNGQQMIYIGATLKVGPLQDNPVGVYAGTYSVSFIFN